MRSLFACIAGLLIPIVIPMAGFASEDFFAFQGAACTEPPPLHCPDEGCITDRVINQGSVVEMETRRTYFLDYPCDLAPGEDVTFILSLHGGGSYGNWQRHYFPLLDYVKSHRLVVATPNSPIRVWTEVDDAYLRNIVEFVTSQLGQDNIKAFWLAGHSQGGMTSNRLLRTDYFSDRVDGWLSLSGGRLGGNPGRAGFGSPPSTTPATTDADAQARAAAMRARFARTAALYAQPLKHDISFIFTTGEREMDDNGLPGVSSVAEQLNCGPQSTPRRVTDTKPGYIYDPSRQNPPRPSWGLLPAPGDAEVTVYPDCKDGRIVGDVVRLKKGHTEGLEPVVTEELIKLMLAAPGGRIGAVE
jgi:pimeloyl-ACP methyl ester carboxylesterase